MAYYGSRPTAFPNTNLSSILKSSPKWSLFSDLVTYTDNNTDHFTPLALRVRGKMCVMCRLDLIIGSVGRKTIEFNYTFSEFGVQ